MLVDEQNPGRQKQDMFGITHWKETAGDSHHPRTGGVARGYGVPVTPTVLLL